MDIRARLRQIENILDNEDVSEETFNTLNREANSLQTTLNLQIEKMRIARELRQKEEREAAELAKVLSLTEEQVEKMYEDACIKYQDVNGMSFEAWYKQSLMYYTVDEKFTVHARARSSDTVELVEHPTLAQAKLTILTRIKYKFYDHAVRGHNFAWDIEDVKQ